MDKKAIESTLKFASNLLLFISLILMVLTVWLENYYLSIGTIVVCVVSLIITVLSAEKPKIKEALKNINLYFYIVCIILSLSVTVANKVIFYVGLVLFILVIFLYFIPMFVNEKEDNKKEK